MFIILRRPQRKNSRISEPVKHAWLKNSKIMLLRVCSKKFIAGKCHSFVYPIACSTIRPIMWTLIILNTTGVFLNLWIFFEKIFEYIHYKMVVIRQMFSLQEHTKFILIHYGLSCFFAIVYGFYSQNYRVRGWMLIIIKGRLTNCLPHSHSKTL